MGAGELARGIAARQFSAEEAVAAHVERQNELQPALNAVAVALHDQAIPRHRTDLRTRAQTCLIPVMPHDPIPNRCIFSFTSYF